MNDELSTQLSKNPNFILQGFLGMQTQFQQAVADLGINLEDYGRKGKGSTRNKGKGKGKPNVAKATSPICTATRQRNKRIQMKKCSLEVAKVPGTEAPITVIGPVPLGTPVKAPVSKFAGRGEIMARTMNESIVTELYERLKWKRGTIHDD
ncbi:hypothetical protein AK812_SmicGene11336 [Symbiodinium microadriaticum]|uniref:Uncharacterized protein n=1 Tax=Symbiodinium microadriaticum TaxID=2951 RepID=A0A1Q9EDG5_SYMMI|nr:hypothetical protein AK812_SmicGene11336 [Symbiodinium microadriaticum]